MHTTLVDAGRVVVVHNPDTLREDVLHLARNIRPIDYHEFASVGAEPEVHSVRMLNAVEPDVLVGYLDSVPAFIFGAVPQWPHTRAGFGFGTKDATRVIPAMTKAARTWFAWMAQDGVTRIEVRIPASCTQSIKWLTSSFDAEVEATLRGVSIFGEPYKQLGLEIDKDVHLLPT